MKVDSIVVLCGGLGTRINSYSKGKPKILIPILKKPFFHYLLKKFKKNNIKNIFLLTGYKSKQIEDYIKNVKHFNFFIYKDGPKKVGTGGSIKKKLQYLPQFFYLTYGDSYLEIKYSLLIKKFKQTNKSIIVIYKNHNKLDNNIYLKNKKIIDYNKNKNYNYIDYGLFLFNKKDLEKFKTRKIKFDLKLYLSWLIKKKCLSYIISKKKFNECGSLEGIKKIEKLI